MCELKCFTLPVGKTKPLLFQAKALGSFLYKINSIPFLSPPPRAPDNQHVFIPCLFYFRTLGLVCDVTSWGEYMTEIVNCRGGWAFRRPAPHLSLAPGSSGSLGPVTQPLWDSALSSLK